MSEEPKDEANPYAPPADAPPEKRRKKRKKRKPCEMDGEVMIVPRDVDLPRVCMKCGGDGEDVAHVKKKFQWSPTWARLLIACGGIGLIVFLIVNKRAELQIPLCTTCAQRWQMATYATYGGVALVMLGVFSMRLPAAVTHMDDPTPGFTFLGLGVLVLVGVSVAMRSRLLQPTRIDDTHVHLKGVHENACREMCP